ncbi:subtilisin-like protease SBT3 [Mercurialis annua]|uniref:subtilisin-like protease SBT3 n=1 Tax=Mercurialis annua TaxID=3986 RepID=UPI0021608664|nr:subtilisin-like protease SBT3 [Mercurialis annua]
MIFFSFKVNSSTIAKMRFSDIFSNYILYCLLLLLLGCDFAVSENEELQTYIIHVDHSQKPDSFSFHESWHRSMLRSLSYPADDKEMLLYSYNHVMHGFSARLTQTQLSEIEKSPAHVATFQESFGKPFTTYSPKFLGLRQNLGLWPAASYGEGVIIGIIDTGIWPESESFNDKRMPPVPQRWKGQCENGTAFGPSNCNRKLIGARSFSKGLKAAGRKINPEYDYDSPRDFYGHGTHTSSTAAGNHVLGVSHFGYAKGTARGIAPQAHVAMYKVLFATDSLESAATDVLAGMDQAIADGVDIMSLSLGFDQTPYYSDVIAIASLSAVEKGIVVVCATGNDGGHNSTHNAAPWITTVGAGTLDRSFTATMTLENGVTVEGTSYFPESIYISNATIYYGIDNENKSACVYGALNKSEVHGKIVFCDNSLKNDIEGQKQEIERVGAYAGILATDLLLMDPLAFTIPCLILPTASAATVKEYVTAANLPKVKVMTFVTTNLGTASAPQVAYFSSRGPDPINPSILKPDILAPGVDVLAAIAPNKNHMKVGRYELATDYALFSGTSMAAPHVAGVAALLRAVHPEWSPAAIRSAIMTTAYNTDNKGSTLKDQWTGAAATPLDFGSGHINPNKAMDPGLIYDMYLQDYVNFICSLGYTDKQISAVIRRSQWNCSQESNDLNYPSFISIFNKSSTPQVKKFSRMLTNVGDDAAAYNATLLLPLGMKGTLEPSKLFFTRKYQSLSFSLSLEIDKEVSSAVIYGNLKWTDQHGHVVSSPVVAVNI